MQCGIIVFKKSRQRWSGDTSPDVQEPEARQICTGIQGFTKSTGWGAGSDRPAKGGFPGAPPASSTINPLS